MKPRTVSPPGLEAAARVLPLVVGGGGGGYRRRADPRRRDDRPCRPRRRRPPRRGRARSGLGRRALAGWQAKQREHREDVASSWEPASGREGEVHAVVPSL